MDQVWNFALNLFFFLECYHFIAHALILFRVRMLPRKDLARTRYYFILDTTSVFIVNFILIGQMKIVATFQIIQHLYYFITWEKSDLAKKVVSWSSLEWQRLPKEVPHSVGFFEVIGTLFDLMVHLVNAYLLASHLTTVEVVLGIALVYTSTYMLLYNPRFAWSSPFSMEPWVERRLNPLSADDIPLTPADKLLGQTAINQDILKPVEKCN